MSLAKQAGKAGALLLARKMWGALVNIGVMAYLARTLDKEDFGLVAISGTLIGFIQTAGVSGIGEYVVFYNGADEDKVLNAAFWLNLALTVLIIVVILIAAPFWADLYKDPRIFNIICLLVIGLAFGMLSSIPQAIFRKSMDYPPMIAIQTIFGTLSQLSQVLFAVMGMGVYSLVLPSAVVAPMLAVALFWRSGFRPRMKEWGVSYWKKILGYTKHVIGARVLGKLSNEGDTLLIGKLLGMEALGIYDIAFKLANLISGQLLPIITNITLPVFARNQHDISTVRRHYLKMIELISFIFFPLFAFLILIAPLLIPLLYGQKWVPAILPFQILCLFVVFRTLSSPTSGLYNALGKPQIGLYFTVVFTPVFLATLYFSSAFGLLASCIAVVTLRNLGSGFHFYMCNMILNLNFQDLFHCVKAPFISSMIPILLLMAVPGIDYFIKAVVFVVIFAIFMWFIFRSDLLRLVKVFFQMVPGNYGYNR